MAIDLKEIVNTCFNKNTENVERYTHNGSTWLIFTEEEKWVIELTKEGTLWYNYYFFQNIMKLLSLDVVENQHYITEWVENTIINPVKHTDSVDGYGFDLMWVEDVIQNGVKKTRRNGDSMNTEAEDAIQNGVKDTFLVEGTRIRIVEDTVQNGVKHTHWITQNQELEVNDAIQNGIKETESIASHRTWKSEEVIHNGVKETKLGSPDNRDYFIEEAIKNGVKYTEYGDWEDGDERLDDIIQNGIKETTPGGYLGFNEIKGKKIHQFETAKQLYYVEDVIEYGIKKTEGAMLFDESQIDTVISDGIKEVQPLPSQEGNKDWGTYYNRQEDRTKPHTKYVDDVVRNGIKETKYCELNSLMMADHIIRDGIKETWGYEKQPQTRIDEVIMNGYKN